MKTNVHFFDVRHGDAIVLEYILEENSSHWIVIDSNHVKRDGREINPTYEYLKKKNVTKIDAVVITHFHADHYTGMDEILLEFEVDKILVPPFLSKKTPLFNKQISKLKQKITEVINRSSDELIGKRAYSLAIILDYLRNNESKIIEADGPENIFRLPFSSIPLGTILLPLAKIRGTLVQMIDSGNFELDSFENMNDASVVLSLKIGSNIIIFGGDSTESQWLEHKRRLNRDGITCLNSNMLKAPHHGSKHNNTLKIYDYLLVPDSNNSVFISSNGKTHPHNELFEIIATNKINPYCTGLAKQCISPNVTSIAGLAQIPSEFRNIISSYEIEDLPTPCQGDITIEANEDSTIIYSSTGNTCVYRPLSPAEIKRLL